MARLRFDNQTGTLGATLTAGGLTLTLASPWTAATVTGSDFVAIELEPPTAGVRSASYEVIYATPVNGSASAVIAARGQEGTAAVQHNAGSVWSHGPTAQDFVDTDFVNPMTTAGDLILGTTAGAPIRLAKGADSQVLTIDPTTHLPLWATPASGGTSVPVAVAANSTVETGQYNPITGLSNATLIQESALDTFYAVRQAGDVFPRFMVDTEGGLYWMDGTSDPTISGWTMQFGAGPNGGALQISNQNPNPKDSLLVQAAVIVSPGGSNRAQCQSTMAGDLLFEPGFGGPNGPIVNDTTDGHTYRVVTTNGALGVQLVT